MKTFYICGGQERSRNIEIILCVTDVASTFYFPSLTILVFLFHIFILFDEDGMNVFSFGGGLDRPLW